MNRYRRPLVISVIVGVMIYFAMILWADWQDIVDSIAELPSSLWVLILGLSLLNYVLRYFRWQFYIKKLDPNAEIPPVWHLTYYFAGFALTTTPGKAGELVRSLYLVNHGVKYLNSISAFFVERLMDLVAIILLSTLCAFYFTDYVIFVFATTAVLVFILLILRRQSFWLKMQNLQIKSVKIRDALARLRDMLQASAQLLTNKMLAVGTLIGLVAWGAEGVAFYYIVQALDLNISYVVAISIYSVAVLVGALSFIPGGLGSTEAVMGSLLIVVGATPAQSVVATLVCRIATLWFAVGIGILAMSLVEMFGESLEKLSAQTELGTEK